MLMKKITLLLACVFGALGLKAQDIYTTFTLSEYPVEFRYLSDFQVKQAAPMSYVITNGVTEYYMKGYKLSNRYTADSLQRLFEKELYTDDEIVNLQMREKGRGSLGPHAADRLVLEFISGSRSYKVYAFMVYFHINHEYNAFLFFFDMESKSSISYEGVLVNMGQTLKWSETLPYRAFKDEATGLETEMPVFWRSTDISTDTKKGFRIDDDRARFTVEMFNSKDSLTIDKAAIRERDEIKANPGMYKEQKFKASAEKTGAKELFGQLTGTYKEDVNGLMRPMLFKRMYYKRVVNGVMVEFHITLETPEGGAEFYAPIHLRMLEKIKLPGIPYEIPKEKK